MMQKTVKLLETEAQGKENERTRLSSLMSDVSEGEEVVIMRFLGRVGY